MITSRSLIAALMFPRFLAFTLCLCAANAHAFNILVDYTFDTNGFFNTPEKRAAMQAAADRFARIIDSPLTAVNANYMGGTQDWRVGFTHPGTGADFEISTAPNLAGDAIVMSGGASANVYDPNFSLPQDTWRLFAGGRAGLGSAGVGGTGTGTNFNAAFTDPQGPMRRGVISETPGDTINDLPAWGGSISFDSALMWHFDLATTAPFSATDFYSIALHEVGHALGLSTPWNQWMDSGASYVGARAVAAYNADNGTSLTSLSLEAAFDEHWKDNTYDSFVFTLGSPNLIGTVSAGTRQDLLMEPIADFTASVMRFEVTNVDAAALRDIGWSLIPEPSSAVFVILTGAWAAGKRRRFKPR